MARLAQRVQRRCKRTHQVAARRAEAAPQLVTRQAQVGPAKARMGARRAAAQVINWAHMWRVVETVARVGARRAKEPAHQASLSAGANCAAKCQPQAEWWKVCQFQTLRSRAEE